MTAAAITAVRVGAERVRVAAASDAVALAALGLVIAVLIGLTWETWGDLGSDTGYDFVAAARVASGHAPYVDFPYFYGPLAPALLGFAGWLGGAGLTPMLALGIVLASAIVFATYALGRLLVGPLGAFLAAAITSSVAFEPGNFSFVLPHTYSASLAILMVLGVLGGLGKFGASGRRRWLVLAGASAGLVALTRPEFELAVVLGALVWFGVGVRARSDRRRVAALFAAPAILLPAAVYGAFLIWISPGRLLLDNLYPVHALAAGGNAVLELQAPLTASSFAHLAVKLLLYAVGVAVIVVAARLIDRGGAIGRAAIAAGALVGVIAVAGSLVRSETLRYGLEFVYGWIPAGAVIAAFVLLRRVWRARHGDTASELALAATVVLAVLAAKTYASFLVHTPVPQQAVYAVPLAALFLVRLHLVELARRGRAAVAIGALWLAFLAVAGLGLTLKDAHRESASVHGPGGTLAARPAEAAVYREAMRWVLRKSSAGEPILAAPQLSWMYTLSGRVDPLPQISLLPGALPTTHDELVAIRRLEAAKVRLVIVDRRSFPEYGHTFFGGSFDRTLAAWLRRRFVRTAELRGPSPKSPVLDVWLRKGTPA